MIVQMSSVKVGGHCTFKPICEKALRKLAADLIHLVGRGFTGRKTLNNMIGQNVAVFYRLAPALFGFHHNFIGVLRYAVKSAYI